MSDTDELRTVYEAILETEYLRNSASLTALFKYLWENRDESSNTLDIWEEALHKYSRSESKDLSRGAYDYAQSVRERCLELRKALVDFSKHGNSPWQIILPAAKPNRGYQLQLVRSTTVSSYTFAFWEAHIKADRDVCVTYAEQLFYENWPERYAIRYYDCNDDHPGAAILELKEKHPDAYKKEIVAAYPFVAAGDIEARDSIMRWFDTNALMNVKSGATRTRNDREIWESSLILLGGAPGNRMIGDVLESHPELDFKLKEWCVELDGQLFGQILVKHYDAVELSRFQRFRPEIGDSSCALHYSAERGAVLAIVTRVTNPYANSAVTIVNGDFGRAIEQLADLLTSEERMHGKEWPSAIGFPMPESFQILFAIPIKSLSEDHLLPKQIEPIAWRIYKNS